MLTQGLWIKILIPKQMLQRLPIILAQVKAGSIPQQNSEFNRDIIQIYYLLLH